jgi:hypothetical protein
MYTTLNQDAIYNVTKAVETKSIFMRANALKMVNGFRLISRQENRIDVNDGSSQKTFLRGLFCSRKIMQCYVIRDTITSIQTKLLT